MSNPAIKLPAAPAKALFMKVLRDHRFSSALVDLQIISTEFVYRFGSVLFGPVWSDNGQVGSYVRDGLSTTLARSRLGGSLKLHLELAADWVRN
jgi:hypothetical protein